MTENVTRYATVTDTLDHGGMVSGVGEDVAAGQSLGQGEEGRVIGHVARGEDEASFFLVQGGQFGFQILVKQSVARDVTRASGSGAILFNSIPKDKVMLIIYSRRYRLDSETLLDGLLDSRMS